MTKRTRTWTFLFAIAIGSTGCGDNDSPVAPTRPPQQSGPSQPPQPPPPPQPPMALAVSEVTPRIGSTLGSTSLQIAGTGFQNGARVTFGGVAAFAQLDRRDATGTAIYVDTPPGAAGTFDVVVTNPDGVSASLSQGYTYAPPESFDFNGNWVGQDSELHAQVLITIERNMLVSFGCAGLASNPVVPPVPVRHGEFSLSAGTTVIISGRIVTNGAAIGTINSAPCAGSFRAWKQE